MIDVTWTDEQKTVLDCDERIVIVVAGPGSGKTRVFAEMLARRIRNWSTRTQGIAALSFTNVAERAIRERLGFMVPYPHFVGTIDSFMLRFVIKPFWKEAGFPQSTPRLIAADLANSLDKPDIMLDGETRKRATVFKLNAIGGTESHPRYTTKLDFGRHELHTLSESDNEIALRGKKAIWRKSGLITYDDSHYIASCILNSASHSRAITDLVVRRFPIILVDEYQDTGHFQYRALRRLFCDCPVRVVTVGDPDQAIYGFAGASPQIFDRTGRIDGAIVLPMRISQRCSIRVCAVASRLSSVNNPVLPKEGAREGSSLLIRFSNDKSLALDLESYLFARWTDGGGAILARNHTTLKSFKNIISLEYPCSSNGGRKVQAAVDLSHSGDPAAARRIISNLLGQILFANTVGKNEAHHFSDERLTSLGVDLHRWKMVIYRVLLESSRTLKDETWNDWLDRIKDTVAAQLAEYGYDARTLSGKFRKDNKRGVKLRQTSVLSAMGPRRLFTAATVHGVKGAEFENVCLIVPKVSSSDCPSIQWWDTDPANEERRVAFVAVTRAKSEFVLCVHEDTFARLVQAQPEFVSTFAEIIELPTLAKEDKPTKTPARRKRADPQPLQ